MSALLSSHGTAISANFGSAHMAAPQVVAENLKAAYAQNPNPEPYPKP